jgi:putative PEP-CTERM system TPR-repeat lipoprotein
MSGARRAAALCLSGLLTSGCSSEAAKQRHFENGRKYLAAERFEEAILEFRSAVSRDQRWGEARFQLAEAYAANGEPELAYRQYIRAADLLPQDSQAQLKAATYLLRARQFEDARSRAQLLLQRDPNHIDAQIIVANALARMRDLDGAVAQIEQAIAADPSRGDSYTHLARLQLARGLRDQAHAAFTKALEIDPTSVPAHLALANFQWSTGDTAAAEQTLNKAYAIDPRHRLTNRVLASFHTIAGRAADAERHLKFVAEESKTPGAALALADFYIAQQRPGEAREILEAIAKRGRARADVETKLADLEYSQGQTAAAAQRLGRVLSREPNNPAALLLRAEWALRERQWEEALSAAQAAVAAKPGDVAAYYVRGEAETRTRRFGAAINSYTEILRLRPDAIDARIALSRLHLARNSLDSAVLYAQEAVTNDPADLEARLALIRAWIARADYTLADAELARLKRDAPSTAEVFVLDGSLRLTNGNTPAARAAFETALRLDPLSPESLATLTAMDVLQKDLAAARARLDTALSIKRDDPRLLVLAAKAALVERDLARAEALLHEAIRLDPLDVASFPLLARLYQVQKRLDAVAQEADDRARREPSNLGATLLAAVLVHTRGDLAEAERRYAQILKGEPRAALAAYKLASIYLERGENLDSAEQLAQNAAQLLPDQAEVVDTLGSIYYKRAMYGQAITQFQQSVAAEPDNATFHYHLGLAFSKNGETDRAREAFRTALRLNRRLSAAQQALATLDP